MDAQAIERLIYEESGLLGVSGISGDMREILASSSPAAREAIDLFEKVSVWVIPTDENLMIARHTRRLLDQRTAGGGNSKA